MTGGAPLALTPGSTIGILGGGQLGRMTAQAAARLGFRTHIFDPDPTAPAGDVSASHTVAAYDDQQALGAFAAAIDVATFEFENIPIIAVETVSEGTSVFPSREALAVCQDRRLEKQACADAGHGTAPFAAVESTADLDAAIAAVGLPAILKTAREGYDGKGQKRIESATDAAAAWAALGNAACVLEGVVDFALEISVIAARAPDGAMATYPAVENRHRNHILAETIAPADIDPSIQQAATKIATDLAEHLGVIGVLAVEMFVTRTGEVLVNEMAPRPHNSGHWTIEGCQTDQFEQLVRCVSGWPLGTIEPIRPSIMTNILGPDDGDWQAFAARSDGSLHLYGKRESRPGRKMGHFTKIVKP